MKQRTAGAARSSVGAKALMAVTGAILLLYVLAHMVGNLQVFSGPDQLNGYAAFLKGLGPLLWILRIGLLAVLVVHVWAAILVVRRNRAARPVAYQKKEDLVTSYAARTMMWSGVLVLAFVIYHLLHFTLGVYDPAGVFEGRDAEGRPDVYRMVIAGFQHVPTAIAYVVAQVILCVHIHHGASSLVQSLGLRGARSRRWTDLLGPGLAGLILLGNLSMPLAVVTGLIGD